MEHEYAARVCPDGRIQTVKAHTLGVKERAFKDAELLGCKAIISLACLLHDMGKNTAYSNEYQHTVGTGGEWHNEKPIHSHAGAKLIYEKYGQEPKSQPQVILSELLETVIMSHHGLFDCLRSDVGNGLKNKLNNVNYDYEEAKKLTLTDILSDEELDALFKDAESETSVVYSKIAKIASVKSEVYYYLSIFERLILSVLINADHTDAAEFSSQEKIPSSYGEHEYWKKCCEYMEQKIRCFDHKTIIQRIRNEISQKALEASEKDHSIIRLSVPTGGGKTLSSLRFALNHARLHHKSRIIYAAPFNSILEQNAEQFKKFLPDDVALLEHFGDMLDYDEEKNQKYRYYSENWGSTVIATSMVQLLNTIFSGKMSSVRRMRSLINAVIIFDEIQSVPIECVSMLNLAINFLANVCGCTVVLCSATQPVLHQVKHKILLSEQCELIDNYREYAASLKRTQIIDNTKKDGYTYQDAADFVLHTVKNAKSVLMIVNTKAAAKSVYRIVKENLASLSLDEDYYVTHLSTNMCPAHRKTALKELKEKLGGTKKVICISTQLIEAGVDISFEAVIRSLAGLDSIIQAAGRCNRNMETDIGNVHIINLLQENTLKIKTIKIGAAITRRLLETMRKNPDLFHSDISSESAVNCYYEAYYKERGKDVNSELDYKVKLSGDLDTTLYWLLSTNPDVKNRAITADRNMKPNICFNQSFKTAGEEFKAIDDYSKSVVVPYGKGEELISELCSYTHENLTKEMIRELQKYSIGLSDIMLKDRVVRDEKTGILILKESFYHDEYGFDEEGEMEMLFM